MNIDLCKPLNLPKEFVTRLKSIESLCIKCEFSEGLVGNPNVSSLVRDINKFCCENRIIGVHYTRALPDSIRSKGLLIRNGMEIREGFLSEHGELFTQKELSIIRYRWDNYFFHDDNSNGNNVFFNFTEVELGRAGTKYLLGMYGGEQVSMCFEPDELIGIKLGKIGEPLIVRCSLEPKNIEIFGDYPWGKVLVSSFHLLINPKAYRIDYDGYQAFPVKPEDIIEIRVLRG